MVTSQEQYNAGYPINGIDARQGNISAIKDHQKGYGYQLRNKRVGKSFFWYKLKRDALAKIEEMKRY